MQVLGIDPGTHRLGWAVLTGAGSKQQVLKHGCLDLPPRTPRSIYLPKIHDLLESLLKDYSLDVLGLESLLFQKNVKTAITVAEARGVIELVAAQHHVPIFEIAPNTIKNCVAGHGGANKGEVERMVGLLLGVDTTKLLDDETDALAVAVTALIMYKPGLI